MGDMGITRKDPKSAKEPRFSPFAATGDGLAPM
jgi:hypothetical protein